MKTLLLIVVVAALTLPLAAHAAPPRHVPAPVIMMLPADVIDESTGLPVPDMQWRCKISYVSHFKSKRQCVLVGTIPLHPITTTPAQ